MSDSSTVMYLVYNDITGEIVETPNPPNFRNPNAALQKQCRDAYNGPSAGSSVGAASANSGAPTPAQLGDPATACTVAASTGLDAATQERVNQALGPMPGLGGVPSMLSSMEDHANMVLNRSVEVMRSIDRTFQPDDVNSPIRCAEIRDFIGSIQGKYNDTLSQITRGLNNITNALVSVPMAVLGAFSAATSALVKAITSGVSTVINAAIKVVGLATNAVLGGVSKAIQGVFNGIGGAVSKITAGITAEKNNVLDALNKANQDPFRLAVPNTNRCLANAVVKAPENNVNPTSTTTPADTGTNTNSTTASNPVVNPEPNAVVAAHGGVENQPPPPPPSGTTGSGSTLGAGVRPIVDWGHPTGYVDSRGYPVYRDGSEYPATQRQLWQLGLVDSPGPYRPTYNASNVGDVVAIQ